jgi:coenzyme PQQ biosynthesis protein PqqD
MPDETEQKNHGGAGMISRDSRPRIAAKARLRYDRKAERYMLLYPEKGLVLNPTAADIAKLCTGEHSVNAIIDQLAAKYGKEAPDIEREVMNFLAALAERALLQESS